MVLPVAAAIANGYDADDASGSTKQHAVSGPGGRPQKTSGEISTPLYTECHIRLTCPVAAQCIASVQRIAKESTIICFVNAPPKVPDHLYCHPDIRPGDKLALYRDADRSRRKASAQHQGCIDAANQLV